MKNGGNAFAELISEEALIIYDRQKTN
jgi:hypothetical protein